MTSSDSVPSDLVPDTESENSGEDFLCPYLETSSSNSDKVRTLDSESTSAWSDRSEEPLHLSASQSDCGYDNEAEYLLSHYGYGDNSGPVRDAKDILSVAASLASSVEFLLDRNIDSTENKPNATRYKDEWQELPKRKKKKRKKRHTKKRTDQVIEAPKQPQTSMPSLHAWLHLVLVTGLALVLREYWHIQQELNTLVEEPVATIIPPSADRAVRQLVRDQHQARRGDTARKVASHGSTVWCWGEDHTTSMCHFHNLCYLPKQQSYVFFHGRQSMLEGVPADRYHPALLDMSSVKDHNTQYFHFVDLPAESAMLLLQDAIEVENRTLMFNRFNPDNLMHVFHDDLFPMYYTLRVLSSDSSSGIDKPFDLQLAFMEGWNPGAFSQYYELFTSASPIYKNAVEAAAVPVCFTNVYVGILKATTWYQYGFHEPQGALPNAQVSERDIRQFTQFLTMRLDIRPLQPQLDKHIVFLSRKHNRLILNELDLTLALAREFKLKVVSVAMETHAVKDMIAIISSASALIGVHGSLLSLAMFLPPGGILIELFPYAVNPANYTPYKTLANISNISYRAWRNLDEDSTVTHPDNPWDLGGVRHLPPEQQTQIQQSKEVPKHLCCRHPEWLYRIYQDTKVDVGAVVKLLKSALVEERTPSDSLHQGISPSFVSHIKCNDSVNPSPPALSISWQQPWNVIYIDHVSVKYEVWLTEQGQEDSLAWILTDTSHSFTNGLKSNTVYNIWIRCTLSDHVTGPFNQEQISCRT